jgi:hypothetical protein
VSVRLGWVRDLKGALPTDGKDLVLGMNERGIAILIVLANYEQSALLVIVDASSRSK